MNTDNVLPMTPRQPDQALLDLVARIKSGLMQIHAQALVVPASPDIVQRACIYAQRTGFAAGVAVMAIDQLNAAFPSLTRKLDA